MSSNLFVRFRGLIAGSPLLVAEVLSASNGEATVRLPDGAVLAVRGTATVGGHVFIRAGLIEGPAPSLTQVFVEV